MKADGRPMAVMRVLAANGALRSSAIIEAGNFSFPAKNIAAYLHSPINAGYIERCDDGYIITDAGRSQIAATDLAATGVMPNVANGARKHASKLGKEHHNKTDVNAKPKRDESNPFRVGIFNDGGLAILAKLGSLELSPEEAAELAGFCAQHFGDGE